MSLAGLILVIGPQKTAGFFFQQEKAKATTAFLGGIAVVLIGYPIIGMIVEGFGFYFLFSSFFPYAINCLRQLPVIGNILCLPGISMVRP